MTAGAAALLVLVGGGATGLVSLNAPEPETPLATPQATAEPDLGAPMLEENPEVVSRAAAAAEPLPKRHAGIPAPTATSTTARTTAHTTDRIAASTRTATAVAGPATGPATGKATGAGAGAGRGVGAERGAGTVPPKQAVPPTDRLSRARVADERADRTGPRPARPAEKPVGEVRREPVAAPVVTTRTDVETRAIPFRTRVVRDSMLPRGVRRVHVAGEPGEETQRYLVTLTDGRQTARRLLGTAVTKAPRHRVVVIGSRRPPVLDPACAHALNFCVPLGRAALCPGDGRDPAAGAPAWAAADERSGGQILILDEDLELLGPEGLDAAHLERAELCDEGR